MANAGFQYEKDLVAYLSPLGYAKDEVAGADDSKPDITLKKGDVTAGCEVKLDEKAAFGSATFQFDYSQISLGERGKPWVIPQEPSGTAKYYMSEAARGNMLGVVNRLWWSDNFKMNQPYVPHKVKPTNQQDYTTWYNASPDKARRDGFSNRQKYEEDAANLPGFKEVPLSKQTLIEEEGLSDEWIEVKETGGKTGFRVPGNAQIIRNYYKSKESWYIQIGNKGLYHMGGDDPLKIVTAYNCPEFNPGTVEFRIRVQSKGGDDYSIQYALYIGGLVSSPVSLPKNNGTGIHYSGLIPDSAQPINLSFLN